MYTWSRTRGYEVSSRGDKRFSAFFARDRRFTRSESEVGGASHAGPGGVSPPDKPQISMDLSKKFCETPHVKLISLFRWPNQND